MMYEMSFTPRPEMQLSKETPVYDALRLGPFHKKIMREMVQKPDAHLTLFILGPVSAGKELITKNFLWQQLYGENIRPIVNKYEGKRGKLSYGIVSTPMANWLGREAGLINSPIGSFTCDEVATSNDILNDVLEKRFYQSGKPAMDIVEGGFFGYPYWPFTGSVIEKACERAKYDPNYMVKAIGIIPELELQEQGMQLREIIHEMGDEKPLDEMKKLQTALNQHGVIFDVSPTRRDVWSGSWGNRRTVRQHKVNGDKHAIREKEQIRSQARGKRKLPDYSYSDLQVNTKLWTSVHMYRMGMLLERFGMSPADYIIKKNKRLSDVQIPFPRGFGNE